MSQTINFDRWIMWGDGWEVSFVAQLENLTVTRNYGSDVATVSGKAWIKSVGGSTNTKAKMRIQIGGTYRDVSIAGSNGSGGWYTYWAGDWYSQTFSFNVSVGATSGSLSGNVYFRTNDINGPQADSATKSYSQSYGSKGYSTIASATNVTLDLNGTGANQPTSTVTWTSYSNTFTYRLHASCNGMTYYRDYTPATSGTVTVNFGFGSDWVDYITSGKSATCTFTLTTYSSGSSIGSNTKTITLYVPSSGISPTVAISTEKVSALSSTYFSDKYCTLIDKLKITLTETIYKWDSSKAGSPITSRNITANGENFTASPATTANALTTVGTNTVTASITDGRGNIGTDTETVNVYWYFYPTVSVKYRHGANYYLDLNGRIAYVGGDQTTKTLRLAIYKGSTLIVDDLNLDSYIASTASGGTYDGYLEISGAYAIPNAYISDIAVDTYEFRLTVSDTVSSATATAYSGIAVMTFGAGGTKITAHKPMTFEKGIQPMDSNGITGLEILPTRTSDRLGGRIKLDRGEDTARDAYIDTYESALRVVDRNPSTAVRASLDLSNGYLDVGGLYLTPNNYMDTNRVGVYPPSLSGGSISSGNSGNATSWWRVLKYSSSYKEIVSIMQLNVNFSSSYGSGYYANLTMMVPTHFFSEGSGNAHWQISANSHSGSGGGIYSGNVHSMNASTGAVGFFLANWVSGTINGLQIVLHGYRY